MITIIDTVRGNNDQTHRTDAGEFLVEQRNYGYASNDGKWVVNQLPELYWTTYGFLRQRRSGAFLGIFETRETAAAAIVAATPMPVDDRMVR